MKRTAEELEFWILCSAFLKFLQQADPDGHLSHTGYRQIQISRVLSTSVAG